MLDSLPMQRWEVFQAQCLDESASKLVSARAVGKPPRCHALVDLEADYTRRLARLLGFGKSFRYRALIVGPYSRPSFDCFAFSGSAEEHLHSIASAICGNVFDSGLQLIIKFNCLRQCAAEVVDAGCH